MHFTLVTVALFVAASIRGVAAGFAINSPTLVQCQESTVSWEPHQAPYNLAASPADDQCGDPLVDFGNFTTTLTTWKVALKVGTKLYLSVVDNDGLEAWSSVLTVGPSNDSTCLPGYSSTSSTSNPSPAPSSDTPAPSPIGASNAGTLNSSSAAIVHQVTFLSIAMACFAVVAALLH